MGLDFLGTVFVALDQFAEEGKLGEAGADLVVDVAGDAGAFLFQGLLLAQAGQLALEFLRGDVMDGGDDDPQKADATTARNHHSCQNGGSTDDLQTGAGLVPDAVFVAGLDLETIGAVRQIGVTGEAILARRSSWSGAFSW